MAEPSAHSVCLDTLEVGEHRFGFSLDDAYFRSVEKTELLGGNVEVCAVLQLREKDFGLHLAVNGTVQVACDRCLDPMDEEVAVEESDWDWDDGVKVLDLAWLAYELIIVNLPAVHRHQNGGCNPHMAALLQDHLCAVAEEETT